jgi:hypothetical protein
MECEIEGWPRTFAKAFGVRDPAASEAWAARRSRPA